MAHVWKHSRQKGSTLLLLLAIADHAHDDGEGAYPSVATLAKKVRMSERNVQYLIKRLEASGELGVLHGQGPQGCNLFSVKMSARVQSSAKGVQSSVLGGEVAFTQTIIKPSYKTIKEEDTLIFEPLRSTLGHYTGFKTTPQLVCKIASKYSNVDLEEEAIKMLSWLEENPKRLCSPAFILNWLSRQNNGSSTYPPDTDRAESTYSPGGGHLERFAAKRY